MSYSKIISYKQKKLTPFNDRLTKHSIIIDLIQGLKIILSVMIIIIKISISQPVSHCVGKWISNAHGLAGEKQGLLQQDIF